MEVPAEVKLANLVEKATVLLTSVLPCRVTVPVPDVKVLAPATEVAPLSDRPPEPALIVVADVELVEPTATVLAPAPVPKLRLWVEAPLPALTVPVEVPVAMSTPLLELLFSDTAPPDWVMPPPKVLRPVPTVKVLVPVTDVAPLRLIPPEPELIVVVEVLLDEPRTTVLAPAPLPMLMLWVEAPVPMDTVPVDVPVAMSTAKLELLLSEIAAPETVAPAWPVSS